MSSITRRGQRSTVSITDFPAELLLLIFKNVHDEVAFRKSKYWPMWRERDSRFYSSTFPSAFASVSKVWSEVMAMEPTFWTTLVIFVDFDDFSLASISSHLSYSRQLPIDVRVTKKAPDVLPASEAHENRRLQAIADIIKPHTHRCCSLHYEVTYTSSLPRISAHLQGTFPLLDDLRLEASKCSEAIETPAEVPWDIQCPELICLSLDGLNFIDVFMNAPHLLDQVQRKLKLSPKIAISHLRQPLNSPNRLSLGDVWPLIHQTFTLHLEDLDLDCDTDNTYEEVYFHESELTLMDLNSSITSAVLSCYHMMAGIEITRCCLDELRYIPFALCLLLENIDDAENLSRLLPHWEGTELEIYSCPGFSDTVLEAIGSARNPDQNFYNLSIVNCSNFSPAVLRHMRDSIDTERRYTIHGRNVPAMMKQDKKWFSDNGIKISWNRNT